MNAWPFLLLFVLGPVLMLLPVLVLMIFARDQSTANPAT